MSNLNILGSTNIEAPLPSRHALVCPHGEGTPRRASEAGIGPVFPSDPIIVHVRTIPMRTTVTDVSVIGLANLGKQENRLPIC